MIANRWTFAWIAAGALAGAAAYGSHQGVAEYVPDVLSLDPGFIQVPYSCVYVARLKNSGSGVSVLKDATSQRLVEQLSDGSRDAIGDVPRGGSGGLAVLWQEDPEGLRPGEAEGPGEGGSGATVNNKTDVWYTYLPGNEFASGEWPRAVAVSDNAATNTGASRPNLFVGKHPDSPGSALSIVAYEERKALGVIEGKYIIYHVFQFDAPQTNSAGVIISNPLENARRVRFVARGTPGTGLGTRLIILWRQGTADTGGPADILARVGRVPAGWDPKDPATVDAGWLPDYLDPAVVGSGDPALALGNAQGLNLSTVDPTDGSMDVTDDTSTNSIEDARALRAILADDFIGVGYSYTPNQGLARFSDTENYDYYVRRSLDGGQAWDTARNLSNLAKDLNAKEPRLVATPASGSGCPSGDPADPSTTKAQDCQNANVHYVAWGTEVNQIEGLAEAPIDLDLFVSRTSDRGENYEAAVKVVEGSVELQVLDDTHNSESQLRMSPDGTELSLIWMQTRINGTEVVNRNATDLVFDTAKSLSVTTPPALNAASKAKLVRLRDEFGTLVVVYADSVASSKEAWDFRGNIFPARDIFMTWSKDDGQSWSTPVNISNTAKERVGIFEPDGNGPLPAQYYYGNSAKPSIFAPGGGDNILVTWTDKSCPVSFQVSEDSTTTSPSLTASDVAGGGGAGGGFCSYRPDGKFDLVLPLLVALGLLGLLLRRRLR